MKEETTYLGKTVTKFYLLEFLQVADKDDDTELRDMGGNVLGVYENAEDAISHYERVNPFKEDGVYHGYSVVAANEDGILETFFEYIKGAIICDYE